MTLAILEVIANLASIVTAIIATLAWWGFILRKKSQRQMLESYLSRLKRNSDDSGKRTIMHLSARLKMTEQQVLDAAFASSSIHCWLGMDKETGRADCIYLEVDANPFGNNPKEGT